MVKTIFYGCLAVMNDVIANYNDESKEKRKTKSVEAMNNNSRPG